MVGTGHRKAYSGYLGPVCCPAHRAQVGSDGSDAGVRTPAGQISISSLPCLYNLTDCCSFSEAKASASQASATCPVETEARWATGRDGCRSASPKAADALTGTKCPLLAAQTPGPATAQDVPRGACAIQYRRAQRPSQLPRLQWLPCAVNPSFSLGALLAFLDDTTATGMASPVAIQRTLAARSFPRRELGNVLHDVVNTRRVVALDSPFETPASILLPAAVHPDGKGVGATRWSCQPGCSSR